MSENRPDRERPGALDMRGRDASPNVRLDDLKACSLCHLVFSPLYPPTRFGGVEKIAQKLAEGLAATQDQVTLVAFERSDEILMAKVKGVRVILIPCREHPAAFRCFMKGQQRVVDWALSNYDRSLFCPPDHKLILHAHDWFLGYAALEIQRRLDTPLITIFHSDKRSEYGANLSQDRRCIHDLQRQLACASDIVFTYSEFMRDCITKTMAVPRSHIRIFRCGLDEHVEPRLMAPAGPLTRVLYLGRLAPEKDLPTLIRAFSIVAANHPSCRLRIVGSGSQLPVIERMVADFDLVRDVEFLPFTMQEREVDAELRAASVLVLPSTFEPFGLVVLEAISRGVPVIVPQNGGPAEIVCSGKTGLTFQAGSASSLAAAITASLGDPRRAAAMASAALRDASGTFEWASAARSIRSACLELACRAPAEVS